MLLLSPFEGWTEQCLAHAARRAGTEEGEVMRYFPEGAKSALLFFCAEADRQMLEGMQAHHYENMKVRERIAAAIMLRLDQQLPHREAVRRAVATMSLPHYAAASLKTLYATVDTIWHAIGDRSTDYSFYSKRAILAGVYGSTLTIWLDDQSKNQEETRAFLDRRIEDVMKIGKTKAAFRRWWQDAQAFLPRIVPTTGR